MHSYQSIIIQDLVEQLAKSIKESKNTLFQAEYIVGANLASKTYIKEQIALKNGIAANLNFISWNRLLQLIFRILKPNTLALDHAKANTINKLVFDALADPIFISAFAQISNYYKGDKSKQYSLAQKITQLFDNYLKYQPELFTKWEDPAFESTYLDEKWQLALWRIYQENLHKIGKYDNYIVFKTIIKEIQNKTERLTYLKQQLPVLHYIQNSQSTKYQIELIQALSCHVTIHFFSNTINNKPYASSSLLNLWTKAAQPYFFDKTVTCFPVREIAEQNTNLYHLQNAILSDSPCVVTRDNTIQIHGHYTAFREVEGLLNILINQYKNSELYAKNCTVYCNDLTAYIPAIHHFFNLENYSIPYRILGECNYNSDTGIHALSSLLRYDIDLMDPEQMLSIIQYPSIMQRFGFDNIPLIRQWISQANMRFQYQNQKSDLQFISWKNGLDRLFYGSCTGLNHWYEQDILMIDAAESQTMDLLVALRYFVDNFYHYKQQTKQAKSIADWIVFTQNFIEFFFNVDEDKDIEHFLDILPDFNSESQDLEDFATWLLMLSNELESTKNRTTLNTSGITFVELKNAQVLPSAFTALLGLNYNTYPSSNQSIDFDLLKDNQEYLAKKARENDKFTMLNAILQTSETLVLSYHSHNPKTNDALPPSIVIEQLVDVLQANNTNDFKPTYHPLQRYNTRYNKEPNLISYTQRKNASTFQVIRIKNSPVELTEVRVSMSRLCNFFTDSFKHFYNYNLGIYIDEQQDSLPNAEVFDILPIDNWQIRHYFFENDLYYFDAPQQIKDKHIKQLKAQGLLPLNNLAQTAITKAFNSYSNLYTAYFQYIGENKLLKTAYTYPINIDSKTYIIEGSARIKNKEYLLAAYSSNINKTLLEWLFTSYILFKQNSCTHSVLLLNQNKTTTKLELTPEKMALIMPEETWEYLIDKFHQGTTTFDPFYLLYSLKNYLNVGDLIRAMRNEDYLSAYCASEIFKPSFYNNYQMQEKLFNNYNYINNLLTRVSNVK
ncbi:exodeoxyribonuclease V subunit gamma [Myroides pelagicus]|uniref:exodeoxyribonuclease V subunit gamma n=1 Tax=Myroides pelagicus TaxID=270914 RepID=UPI002DBB4A8F|nr:exodeoxyribonuclease V subunit gamma [Myroides pelagicus]MEC4114920.1 exodeoxyribonuclease V subunit gamma [Myroides pelagicus]